MSDQLLPRRGDFSLSAFVLKDGIENIEQVVLRSAAFYFADDATLRLLESFKDLLPSPLILVALCLFVAVLGDKLAGRPCDFDGNVLPLLLLDVEGKRDIIPR